MRYLFFILSITMLSGCSETIQLTRQDGGAIANGTLKLHLNSPHRLTVVLNGKTYEGDVESKEVSYSTESLHKRLGATSKHYEAITSGLDTDHHVHQYKGILKAEYGATLTCEYLSSREKGTYGTCDDDKGQTYEVHK